LAYIDNKPIRVDKCRIEIKTNDLYPEIGK